MRDTILHSSEPTAQSVAGVHYELSSGLTTSPQKHYPSFLVVLKVRPPLIYHGGSRLVPGEDVGPLLGRCSCVSNYPEP